MGEFILVAVMVGAVLIPLVSIISIFRIRYLLAVKGLGKEAADRDIRYRVPRFLVFFVLLLTVAPLVRAFIVPLLAQWWKHSDWAGFLGGLFVFGIWPLSWLARKRAAGRLLLNVGRTWYNKQLFRAGVVGIALAVIFSLVVFATITSFSDAVLQQEEIYHQAPKIAVAWLLPAFGISLGLTKLELRENGICFLYTFVSWRRMKSYFWERSKPNTLTIRFVPLLPLSPGFMSIAIPNQHRNEVNRIVQTHISVNSSSDTT